MIVGFFYSDTTENKKRKQVEMPVGLMHEKRCKACPRNHDKKLCNPKMLPTGAKRKTRIYILGEAPGENEDKRGRQFVGKAGKYIRSHIPKKWNPVIRWNNTIRCRPPNNRDPLAQEIECCRMLQEEDIAKYKPDVLVLAGLVPTRWCFDTGGQGIYAWRGRLVPVSVQGHKCYAYPILHPSGVLRRSGGMKYRSDTEKVFERDLKQLFKLVNRGLPDPIVVTENHSDGITWIKNGDEKDLETVHRWLRKMAKEKVCGLDIETKNLRPYHDDSKIISCSITTRKHGTFVFPLDRKGFWKTSDLQEDAFLLLRRFIVMSGKKICHNTKFEQEWFAYYFRMKTILNNNWGDTLAMGYVLDNRKKMLNLDTMILLYFGFRLKTLTNIDIKSDLEKYSIDELCEYNGLDSKWTLELYYALLPLVKKERLFGAVKERLRTGATLVGSQIEGVPVNKEVATKLGKKIQRKINAQVRLGRKTKAWKKFVELHGRDPNPDSHKDMVSLFDRIMKIKECKTESGGVTTADHVISKLSKKKYPVIPIILKHRSLTTVKGTFLDPLPDLIYGDGRLHTVYSHLYTVTNRLSSEDPNMQNWPKHLWRIIRSVIQEVGKEVISFDYAQIEAKVLAMASKDPAFVQMLWDEYDVHDEWAERIHDEYKRCLKAVGISGKFSDPEVRKEYRQQVKNRWVFPLFFGSNAYSVAADLNLPDNVAGYLYNEFWEVFGGIKDWQAETASFYDSHGYVETLTGKRRYAPCSYNEQINHPIQGTAADMVNDAANRLLDKGIQFNINVHDDLTFIAKRTKKLIRKIAAEMCRPTFDFINVPLVVEVESGPNWYEQEEAGIFSSNKTFKYH